MDERQAFPVIRQTVLDTADPRRLAEFYRQLFGLRYRPGDEPPEPGQPDQKGQDWALGARLLADHADDPQEPLRVYADPAGHPFCIFAG